MEAVLFPCSERAIFREVLYSTYTVRSALQPWSEPSRKQLTTNIYGLQYPFSDTIFQTLLQLGNRATYSSLQYRTAQSWHVINDTWSVSLSPSLIELSSVNYELRSTLFELGCLLFEQSPTLFGLSRIIMSFIIRVCTHRGSTWYSRHRVWARSSSFPGYGEQIQSWIGLL